MVGADGKNLSVIGSTHAEIKLSLGRTTKLTEYKLTVVKDLCADTIIGLQLMKMFHICIDTNESRLQFKKNTTKSGLRTFEEITVPKRSQMVIKTRVNTVGTIMTLPVQLNSSILVGNSISDVADNVTETLILNLKDELVTIKSGTHSGSLGLILS